MKAEDLMVYAITDRYWLNGAKLADQVEDVLKNGATFLQLREKSFTHEEMVAVKGGKVTNGRWKI